MRVQLMLALLLLSILTLAFGARLVEADGMIQNYSSLPHASLASTQTTLADTVDGCRVDSFADPVTVHFAATMGTTSLQQYDSVIFSNAYDCFYAKTLADIDGYTSSSLDSQVKSALTSMPMIGSMPRTYQSYWLVYDRYMINAYRWSQQWNIETAKWNETQAAEEAINCYHKAGRALLGLDLDRGWQYGNRYYDENGQTLDIMNKLGSSSDALAIWNYLNSAHWNGQIYAYTPGGGFECEVGPFAMLIGYYHATNPTIPYFDRINLDLYNKMLINGWSSPAWSSSPGVMKHASTNPEKRLENTLDGFTALQAYYCLGSTDYKQAFQSLLTDSPKAWEALVSSPLYSSGKFSWREGQSVSDAATASGMMLLLLEGVVPDTGCLAIPLNEWRYQDQATMLPYTHFRFDYSSRRIRIPVFAGSIKFQFGTSVANATFPSNGIFEVQFSLDWNNVLGVNLVSPLSDQFYYLQPTGPPPPPPSKPTIYIRADGSIDPPDAPISTVDNVTYTLTSNITSDADGIVVERDNIVVDGAGYTVDGPAPGVGKGIALSRRSNVTIKNMEVRKFECGIWLFESSNDTISGNNITNNGLGIHFASSSGSSIVANNLVANDPCGIYFWPSSDFNSMMGNNITSGGYGILAYGSSNSICNNNITDHSYGIAFAYGSNNSISGNAFRGCGLSLGSPSGNIVEGNSVNGKPLVFLENMSDYTVDNAGQVILVRCNNIRVENLNLSDTTNGLELWETNNSRVSNNNITANKVDGILLLASSNNTMEGNNVTGNLGHGINFYSSPYNTLRDNNLADNFFSILVDGPDLLHFVNDIDTSNTVNGRPIYYWIDQTGKTIPSDAGHVALVNCTNITVHDLDLRKNAGAVLLAFTANSTITRNNMTGNGIGIHLINSTDNSICDNDLTNNYSGILLRDSSNDNIVEGNNMTGNHYSGIVISSSSYNTISGNNVTNNWYGIVIKSSSNNSIYHNNFFGNSHQFYAYDSTNVWDDDYPSGGNYWSDYSGIDVKRGPGQDLPGSDGIGDTPYIIDSDNQDRYPVVHRDVAALNVVSSKTVVGQNYGMNVSVTVENQGDYIETFNVTVCANMAEIETREITLSSGNFTALTFAWDTTGFALGNYTVSAYAWPVQGETETANNNLTGSTVIVTHVGDITGDGKCDTQDLARVSAAYGSLLVTDPLDPRYGQYWHPATCPTCPHTPNADITNDGKVDIQDLARTSANFGWHQP